MHEISIWERHFLNYLGRLCLLLLLLGGCKNDPKEPGNHNGQNELLSCEEQIYANAAITLSSETILTNEPIEFEIGIPEGCDSVLGKFQLVIGNDQIPVAGTVSYTFSQPAEYVVKLQPIGLDTVLATLSLSVKQPPKQANQNQAQLRRKYKTFEALGEELTKLAKEETANKGIIARDIEGDFLDLSVPVIGYLPDLTIEELLTEMNFDEKLINHTIEVVDWEEEKGRIISLQIKIK